MVLMAAPVVAEELAADSEEAALADLEDEAEPEAAPEEAADDLWVETVVIVERADEVSSEALVPVSVASVSVAAVSVAAVSVSAVSVAAGSVATAPIRLVGRN